MFLRLSWKLLCYFANRFISCRNIPIYFAAMHLQFERLSLTINGKLATSISPFFGDARPGA